MTIKKLYLSKIILSLFFITHSTLGISQTYHTIGNGTGSGTSTPIGTFYEYSVTESIYLGSEMNGNTGEITKIAFDKASGSSNTAVEGVRIFMKLTNTSTTGTNDYSIDTTGYVLVWAGSFTNNGLGWQEVTLTTPFNYPSTSNNISMVVCKNNGFIIPSGRPQYRYTTTSPDKKGADYNDFNVPWVNNNTTLTPKWERPNIQLYFGTTNPVSCAAPTNVSINTITSQSATVSWTPPASIPSNGYDIYYSTNATAPIQTTVANATSATTSVTINTLAPSTHYYVWVRSACSNILKSEWTLAVDFTTNNSSSSCLSPSGLIAGNVTTTTADVSWTTVDGALQYQYYYSTSSTPPSSSVSGTVSNNANTTLSNLSPSTTYYCWVKTICSSSSQSDWNVFCQFTTLCNLPQLSSISEENVGGSSYQFSALDPQYVSNYTWEFGDGNNSNLPSPVHTYSSPGQYTVSLCVTNECQSDCDENNTYTTSLQVGNTTNIDRLISNEIIKIYPNPATNYLHIESTTNDILKVEVVNITGQKIVYPFSNSKNFVVDISTLPKGAYFLKLVTNLNIATYQFIKL